jgi:transposase
MSKRCRLVHPLDSSALSSLGERRKDARVERRVVALRLIAAGQFAKDVGPIVGVNEKTVREWVAAFNSEGVSSLTYDKYQGGIPHLTPEQESELAAAIREVPPPEMKVEVWRGWAVRQWVKERFGVDYCIYHVLHRIGFSSLMPRPLHPASDPVSQEEFKKRRCRPSCAGL